MREGSAVRRGGASTRGTGGGKTARPGLHGGCRVTGIPTVEVLRRVKVAILPIPTAQGDLSSRAIAGEKHAQGETAGEALDALTAQLSADEASTLIIVQSLRPDRFCTAAQQQ
jgi:hypothetical protein